MSSTRRQQSAALPSATTETTATATATAPAVNAAAAAGDNGILHQLAASDEQQNRHKQHKQDDVSNNSNGVPAIATAATEAAPSTGTAINNPLLSLPASASVSAPAPASATTDVLADAAAAAAAAVAVAAIPSVHGMQYQNHQHQQPTQHQQAAAPTRQPRRQSTGPRAHSLATATDTAMHNLTFFADLTLDEVEVNYRPADQAVIDAHAVLDASNPNANYKPIVTAHGVPFAARIRGVDTSEILYKALRGIVAKLKVRNYKNKKKEILLELIAARKIWGPDQKPMDHDRTGHRLSYVDIPAPPPLLPPPSPSPMATAKSQAPSSSSSSSFDHGVAPAPSPAPAAFGLSVPSPALPHAAPTAASTPAPPQSQASSSTVSRSPNYALLAANRGNSNSNANVRDDGNSTCIITPPSMALASSASCGTKRNRYHHLSEANDASNQSGNGDLASGGASGGGNDDAGSTLPAVKNSTANVKSDANSNADFGDAFSVASDDANVPTDSGGGGSGSGNDNSNSNISNSHGNDHSSSSNNLAQKKIDALRLRKEYFELDTKMAERMSALRNELSVNAGMPEELKADVLEEYSTLKKKRRRLESDVLLTNGSGLLCENGTSGDVGTPGGTTYFGGGSAEV